MKRSALVLVLLLSTGCALLIPATPTRPHDARPESYRRDEQKKARATDLTRDVVIVFAWDDVNERLVRIVPTPQRRGPLQAIRDFYRDRITPYTTGCTPFDEYTCAEEFNQHRWRNYNAQLSAFTSHPSYPEAKVALDREDWKEVRRLIAEMKRNQL